MNLNTIKSWNKSNGKKVCNDISEKPILGLLKKKIACLLWDLNAILHELWSVTWDLHVNTRFDLVTWNSLSIID